MSDMGASVCLWTHLPVELGAFIANESGVWLRVADHSVLVLSGREVFLQANFRFAVAEGCDVRSYAADADRMIAWEDVVQVDVLGGAEAAVCPITLEPLVAPQITGCGHLFSFPAILQHALMHGGPEFRAAAPCPLCFTPIVARELRSARCSPSSAHL
jgi:hypothetical protein